jgi:16S rRNA (cytidine1402-2'-O)-methyltransferase
LYEAPGRVAATLSEIGGTRQAVVARELTKQFEELRRGTVEELATYYEEHPPRGEVVVLIAGGTASPLDEAVARKHVRSLRKQGASAREIMQALTVEHGVPRNTAYRLVHEEEEAE